MTQGFQKEAADESVRLNKFISDAGVCSRREADRLIESGRVVVDGQRATLGSRVHPGAQVLVDGEQISREEEMILLAVNKPRGIVCTTDTRWGDETIYDLLHYPKRIFSIGRLDKESEGLLLMTNNGDILNKIMRAGNYHEKEYLVTVDREVTPDFLEMLRGGIYLAELGVTTRPCRAERTGRDSFRIILTQGLNRQIRRMCAACGYQVQRLVRVRIMNIRLGDLQPGAYREVSRAEYAELQDGLLGSVNPGQGKMSGHQEEKVGRNPGNAWYSEMLNRSQSDFRHPELTGGKPGSTRRPAANASRSVKRERKAKGRRR